MQGRAGELLDRARERIRRAAEHDLHTWSGHGHDHALPHPVGNRHDQADLDDDTDLDHDLDHDTDHDHDLDDAGLADADLDDGGTGTVGGADDPIAGGDPRPGLGSPDPAAPDLDMPGGVSGPPRRRTDSGRAPDRRRRPGGGTVADRADGDVSVPTGLRTAAAWSWRVILIGALLYLLLRLADMLLEVFVPVLVAVLLSALLQPGAGFLVKRRWPRSAAALAMLLVGLAVLGGIITLVVNRVVADYADLANQVSQGLSQVQKTIVRTFPISQAQLDQLLTSAQNAIGANKGAIASGALSTAGTVTQVATGFLLTLLTLFFFLKDGRSIWLWIIGLMPRSARAYVDEAGRRSWRTLVSYVRATIAVALIDAIGIGIGLFILRVPLAFPLAALVFVGAFIPIIGSFIAGTVAVLVALVSNGFVVALITLGVVILVMQLEGHVFSPLLLGRAVRVHPLAVVLSIAIGLIVGSVFGALIAVPFIACLNVGGTYLVHRHDGPPPPDPRPERARPAVTAGPGRGDAL